MGISFRDGFSDFYIKKKEANLLLSVVKFLQQPTAGLPPFLSFPRLLWDILFPEFATVNRDHLLIMFRVISLKMNRVKRLPFPVFPCGGVLCTPVVSVIHSTAFHVGNPVLLIPDKICSLVIYVILTFLSFIISSLHHLMDFQGIPCHHPACLLLQLAQP